MNPFVNNNMDSSQQKLTFEEVGHKKPSKVHLVIMVILTLAIVGLVIPLGKCQQYCENHAYRANTCSHNNRKKEPEKKKTNKNKKNNRVNFG